MAQTRHPLVSYQPLRLIFQLSYTIVVVFRLPYYLAISFIPFLRPNKKWTAKQTFMTCISHPLLDVASRVGITQALTLKSGAEGARFQKVTVASSDFYKGPLASKSSKPAICGGTWFPSSPGADLASKTVVLYFHGRAFVQGDGRTESCGPIAKYFLDSGSAEAVFSVQYRLSGYAKRDPFPAALQDALSSYLFLLHDRRVPANQIIVAGDSAGGNLVTALLRYISEFGAETQIAAPKCAVLLSPWVDPLYVLRSRSSRPTIDFLPRTYEEWGASAYTTGLSNAMTNPYITPLGNPFQIPAPLFVNAGTSELIFDGITSWAAEMREVKGNRVELNHEMDAVHDTYLGGHLMGFDESAWGVATKVAEFVKSL